MHRRPRIGILATGDEIALPGEPVPPGGIVSSNAHALAALVRANGGEPLVLPIAPDDRGGHRRKRPMAARGCDLLVTTGGASVGEHDLVQSALGPEGFALDFWRIAMRPGKPLIWGRLGRTPLLGLPGNPVSALVCGVVFLLPALRPAVRPARRRRRRTARARLGAALPENDRRFDFLRARLETSPDGEPVARPSRCRTAPCSRPWPGPTRWCCARRTRRPPRRARRSRSLRSAISAFERRFVPAVRENI